MFAEIYLILNLKAAGMSKTKYFFPGLEIAVSKCHGFF